MTETIKPDNSTRTRANAYIPLVEPEACARCAPMATFLRRHLAAQKLLRMVFIRRWSPLSPRLQESAETCACGYAVLRGYLPAKNRQTTNDPATQ